MSTTTDYKKYAILYVDDEEKSLKSFARAFAEQFWILTASSAHEGLNLLEQHKDQIGVLMTDQRMPGEKGVWLLEHARQIRPQIIRVLATGFSDMDAIIAAVNSGSIYRYVHKPWDPPQLEITLRHCLDYFTVQRERDQLLKEKTAVLHQMMVADRIVSLGLLAAGMSHHIRNSLVAVKTFLDLTPMKLKEESVNLENSRNSEFWKDYHQNALGQLDKINDLLKDLWLASERPPFHFLDQVELHEVLDKVLADMKPALDSRQLRVLNQIPITLPRLQVDRPKFTRIFELILKDEIANLPAGSHIDFRARLSPDSTGPQPEILMEIEDNGPGATEEALRVMFDPFVVRSDSPQEYGINLMACYFIVHHHGGRIEAHAAKPHGTIISLRLQTNPNQPPAIEENPELLQKVVLNNTLWERVLTAK
jgi:two-component system probable response regulator PhcQ